MIPTCSAVAAPAYRVDLSKVSDDAVLKARIAAEAKNACDELDRITPLVDKDPKCEAKAVRSALAQVEGRFAAGAR